MSVESRRRSERHGLDWRVWVACGALGVVLLSGCDNKDGSSTADSPAAPATKTGQPTVAPSTGRPGVTCRTTVKVEGTTIRPSTIFFNLPAGATVVSQYIFEIGGGEIRGDKKPGTDGDILEDAPEGFFVVTNKPTIDGYDFSCEGAHGISGAVLNLHSTELSPVATTPYQEGGPIPLSPPPDALAAD